MTPEDDRISEIVADWLDRRGGAEEISPEDVLHAHPELAEELRARFLVLMALDAAYRPPRSHGAAAGARKGDPPPRRTGRRIAHALWAVPIHRLLIWLEKPLGLRCLRQEFSSRTGL